MKPLLISLFVLNFAANAQAADFAIGVPSIAGSGCPQGSVSAAIAPDGSAISIIFDQFSVSAPAGTRTKIIKNCTFAIPVRVAPGYVLEATSVDYRGYSSAPRYITALINTTGPIFNKSFTYSATSDLQNTSSDFYVTHTVGQRFNRCEQQNELRFTTTITLGPLAGRATIPLSADALIAVDSSDMSDGAIKLVVQARPCTN